MPDYNLNWDTDAIPVAKGAYVTPLFESLAFAQTESDARDAISAASSTQVNNTKQPVDGVEFSDGGYAISPATCADVSANGDFAMLLSGRIDSVNASTFVNVWGSTRGVASRNVGGFGFSYRTGETWGFVFYNEYGAGAGESLYLLTPMTLGVPFLKLATFEAATGTLTIYDSNGTSVSADWSANFRGDAVTNLALMVSMLNTNTPVTAQTVSGGVFAASAFTRMPTVAERAAIFASAGKIIPPSLRANTVVQYTLDDGAGYQLRDRIGIGDHALTTATGATHLLPKESGKISQLGIDATSPVYLLGDRPVLPANALITHLTVNGETQSLAGASVQDLALTRIRIADDGNGDTVIQRSNGTAHDNLLVVPIHPGDIDINLLKYEIIDV